MTIRPWHFIHYIVSLELACVAAALGIEWLAILSAWSLLAWVFIVRWSKPGKDW